MRAMVFAAVAFSAVAFSHPVLAQYPTKPVRMVVPFAPGGVVDTVARLVGARMSEGFRQPVIVENRAGAGGIIAADLVAKSAPDGYTMLLASISHAVTPSMYRKLPFDPLKDLTAVSQITGSALLLVAGAKQPFATLQALAAAGKQKPGSINYGSTGVGTAGHLAVEMVNIASGAGMVHVPYKGDAPLTNALVAGEVHVGMAPSSAVVPHVQGGRLRALAVTGSKRLASLPDVPTLSDAGLAVDLSSWIGVFAPAGVPPENLARFQGELAKVLATPEIRGRFAEWGYDAVGSTPAEFAARYQADVATYARVVKEARIPLQD
jgi:tripartite-type tricarboxylate transporter receptor subunit TctC